MKGIVIIFITLVLLVGWTIPTILKHFDPTFDYEMTIYIVLTFSTWGWGEFLVKEIKKLN